MWLRYSSRLESPRVLSNVNLSNHSGSPPRVSVLEKYRNWFYLLLQDDQFEEFQGRLIEKRNEIPPEHFHGGEVSWDSDNL